MQLTSNQCGNYFRLCAVNDGEKSLNDQVISSAGILQTRPKLSKVVIVVKLVVAVTNERSNSLCSDSRAHHKTRQCAHLQKVFSPRDVGMLIRSV
jgi:hypothetical protein